MINRFSQLKQTISDELQQAAAQSRPTNDPVSVIERNSKLLYSETPNVDNIIMDLEESNEGENSVQDGPKSSNEKDASSSSTPDEMRQHSPNNEGGVNSGFSESKSEIKQHHNAPLNEGTPVNDPSIAAKLTKFAKYEEKYPQLLKAYKMEKKKGELVKLYEKVLSEHTPCDSISKPQVLVDYLNELTSKADMQHKELQRIQSELKSSKTQVDILKAELNTLKNSLNSTKAEVTKLNSELQSTRQKCQQLEQSVESSATDAKLEAEYKAKIDVLESRLDAAEQERDSAAKSHTTIKSQSLELNTRLREARAEMEVLKDELHEAEMLAENRLQELCSMKNQLHSKEKGTRKSVDNSETQLSKVLAEKEQLEADVELLNKRIVRESEQLNLQIKLLRAQLKDSELHETELRRQIAHSQNLLNESRTSNKSEYPISMDSRPLHNEKSPSYTSESGVNSGTPESLHEELNEAREAVVTANKANDLLKQVNADNALRIEKLQKSQRALAVDIEQLRHENLLLKKQSRKINLNTAESVLAHPGDESEKNEKQQAYLKNVLLGFIEHKGQRKSLMPVIATLLGMKDSEVELFMREFQ